MTASAGPALKQLHREFGDRVAFVTLYVREAHPGERYPQAETLEQKLVHARDYKERDDIPWPVAVDSVDGVLHQALDPKPNAAYLVGADGTVAFRLLWSNHEEQLRRALEELVRGERPGRQSQRVLLPMARGLPSLHGILELAGPKAARDVIRAAPPMYLAGRIADALEPLPRTARGALGLGASMALVGSAAAAIGLAVRRLR